MSWAFLIYAIDVLSTDGSYGGWGFLFTLGLAGYFLLALIQANPAGVQSIFYVGKVMTLSKSYHDWKAGDSVVVYNVHSDGTLRLKHKSGSLSDWVRFSVVKEITVPEDTPTVVQTESDVVNIDELKPFRKIACCVCFVSALGIGYANFMPTKDTAYKMLAAYVGQTVSETPEVRELAGNSIDFLNKAIKKYSSELDVPALASDVSQKKEDK